MTALLRKLTGFYIASWVILLWSAVCISIGAAWAFIAIVVVLKSKGLL